MEKAGGIEEGTVVPKIFLCNPDLYFIKMLRTGKVQDRHPPFRSALDPSLHTQHQSIHEIDKSTK